MKQGYNIFIIGLIVFCLSAYSCSSQREASGVFATTTFKPIVLQNNPDGTLVVKVWGYGANRSEAVDNALRDALAATIYDGFYEGQGLVGQQPVLPLVGIVNARQKFSYYFNPFFSKGGDYLMYVKENKDNPNSRVEAKSESRESIAIIAVVNRPALEHRLIKDNIINP